MRMNSNPLFKPQQAVPGYETPRVLLLLSCDGTGICEESRYNSVDDTEYFGDGGEDNL